MTPLNIRLLGTRRVELGGQLLDLPKRSDTLRLLACLLLAPEPATLRSELAARLWPEAEPARARANLRHGLHQLRHWLPPHPTDRPWLLVSPDRAGWNPEAESWADVQALQRAAEARQRPRQSRLAELRDALELCNGPLLPGFEDAWTLSARAELARCQQRILEYLGAELEAAGNLRAAASQSQALLNLDPTHEGAHRRLMRLHAARGDRAAVMAQAASCREALRQHLDLAPEPATDTLLVRLLEGLEAEEAPAGPSPGGRARLQERAQPYANRIDHLDRESALHEALGETRLLTVWGPGGVGKSCLARRLNDEADEDRPLTRIALDGIADTAAMLDRLATALGARGGPRTIATLAAEIGQGKRCLLLDDCEQLSEPLAELCERLLGQCAGLRLVLTSRERLRIRGELALSVACLSLEDETQGQMGEAGLLLARGLALEEPWEAGIPEALQAIGRCLDGLPRALLQATKALRAQAPALLARDLQADPLRLDALARLEDERFEGLGASFEHDLLRLATGPRQLLARLAGSETSLGLPALMLPRPGSGSPPPPPSPSVLIEHLAELRARALVEVDTGADGSTRYRLLNSIRHVARRRLQLHGA